MITSPSKYVIRLSGQALVIPNDEWFKPISGKETDYASVSKGQEAVYAFKDERPAVFSKVPSEGWLELKIEGGVVSGVINLESPGVRAPGWRPRHDKRYHEA